MAKETSPLDIQTIISNLKERIQQNRYDEPPMSREKAKDLFAELEQNIDRLRSLDQFGPDKGLAAPLKQLDPKTDERREK